MKKFLCIFSVFVLAAGFVFMNCSNEKSQPVTVQTHTISVGGSTSVTPLMELFQADYEQSHGSVKITVSGTGSGDGITGTDNGTYEIGMSSRELTPAEIGKGLEPHIVAIDGIAVIMNNSSPVSGLTMAQIKDIYTGTITQWQQLGAAANGKTGGIAVISREPGSGTRGAFQELVGFKDGELVSNAIIFDGTGAIKSAVAGNTEAIGYISLGSVDNTAKAVSVDGVAATKENVKGGTYKIARPFILITKKGAAIHPATQAFLDWTMDAGQTIVEKSWISIK
ncbi:MAG: phosphate ABC transporter substrate-binding protein [Treponema sp.]|nr:phosphate ABC transporter substrate-binding protein [Treponema sp.]